jgi:hypothetical protein
VTSQAFTIKILRRLNKLKYLIFLGAFGVAVLMYFYAKKIPAIFSVRSTVFPLTPGPDKNSTTSKISELIGAGGGSKSLTEEANVNIEEVAKSKKTREAVAGEILPNHNNKRVAEVLIDEYNLRKRFYAPRLERPKTEKELTAIGANLLKNAYLVKFNKNSLLEVTFSSTNKDIITPISYILINKISQFYIELKVEKAQFDFEFTERKVDSLEKLLKGFDKKQIEYNNTNLFVRPSKLKYSIPKENLENEKMLVLAQKNGAASNREEALWRKQKVTPIIKILDTPEPPFDVNKPSKIIYAFVGFFVGLILFSLLFVSGIIYSFANNQINTIISEKLTAPDVDAK